MATDNELAAVVAELRVLNETMKRIAAQMGVLESSITGIKIVPGAPTPQPEETHDKR